MAVHVGTRRRGEREGRERGRDIVGWVNEGGIGACTQSGIMFRQGARNARRG